MFVSFEPRPLSGLKVAPGRRIQSSCERSRKCSDAETKTNATIRRRRLEMADSRTNVPSVTSLALSRLVEGVPCPVMSSHVAISTRANRLIGPRTRQGTLHRSGSPQPGVVVLVLDALVQMDIACIAHGCWREVERQRAGTKEIVGAVHVVSSCTLREASHCALDRTANLDHNDVSDGGATSTSCRRASLAVTSAFLPPHRAFSST